MGESSKIQWTDHTFNPWIGCSKVHAGCEHCYAEADFDHRKGRVKWGPGGTRSKTSEGNWQEPLKWDKTGSLLVECENRDCRYRRVVPEGLEETFCPACGDPAGNSARPRVFCASLCDVFENWDGPIVNHGGHKLYRDRKSLLGEAIRTAHECLIDAPYIEPLTLDDLRRDLFGLIDQTPHLDWQLLTKRPENVRRMWRVDGNGKDPGASNYLLRDNVWLGTSVSDQQTADKMIPDLLKCRDLVSKLFVSVEPLLGPVDLANLNDPEGWSIDPLRGIWQREYGPTFDEPGNVEGYGDGPTLDWVIVGGESGNQARRCDVGWIRDIVVQCKAAGVPCFVKQLGAFVVDSRADGGIHSQIRDEECWPDLTVDRLMPDNDPALMDGRVLLTHPKGGDPAEWPEDLRVREFPDG